MTDNEQDSHIKNLGMKCHGCGAAAGIRLRTYVPPDELIKRQPELAGVLMFRHEGQLPTCQTKRGPMVPSKSSAIFISPQQ